MAEHGEFDEVSFRDSEMWRRRLVDVVMVGVGGRPTVGVLVEVSVELVAGVCVQVFCLWGWHSRSSVQLVQVVIGTSPQLILFGEQ